MIRKKLPTILAILLFLTGAGIFCYPAFSDWWNSFHQSEAIAAYQETVDALDEEEQEKVLADARAWNEALGANSFSYDVFSEVEEKKSGYTKVLNPNGDGIMGYLSIPSVDIRLSIYHGCSDPVLQAGAGHMSGTSLPIGGEGTHAVLAGHRGLPSARLFTDVDRLEPGDRAYLQVLGETLAYEVDQISDMVDKDDVQALSGLMQQEAGEDYLTLFTCTPYGVNSHRLLVRLSRVEEPVDIVKTELEQEEEVLRERKYLVYFLPAGLVTAGIIACAVSKKRKERT